MSKKKSRQKKGRVQKRKAGGGNKLPRRIYQWLIRTRKTLTYTSAKPVVTNVYWLKKKEKIANIPVIYEQAKQVDGFYEKLFPNLYPESIKDIKSSPHEDWTVGDSKDIVWVSLLLSENSDQINRFLRYENNYEKNFLLGEYKKCESILDKIDEEICVSLWSIEQRIYLVQKNEGLKAQKEYVVNLRENSHRDIPFILYHVSNKVEDKVSSQWFKKNVEFILDRSDLDADYLAYLKYRVVGISEVDSSTSISAIMNDSNSSIIDIYLTFIRSVQKNLSEFSNQGGVNKSVSARVEKLSGKITDFRLKKLALCMGVEVDLSGSVNKDILHLMDEYTRGEYSSCIVSAEKYLIAKPYEMSVAEIYAKCCIRTGSVSVFCDGKLSGIIDSFISILNRDDDIGANYNLLLKESLVNSGLNYAHQIDSFITRELSEVRGDHVSLVNMGYLNSEVFTPLLCNTYSHDEIVSYVLREIEKVGSRETLELYMAYRFAGDDFESSISTLKIPESRKRKLIANRSFFLGEYKSAITSYHSLNSCGDQLAKVETLGHYSISCMEVGDFDKGCELIADAYISNTHFHLNLPFRYAVEKLGFSGWPKTIDVPILFYIYSEHAAKDKMEHLRYAFEYFLKTSGVVKPSQLFIVDEGIDENKLVFFYEKICVYDVMKRYIPLKGTNDVDIERLAILNILRKLRPDDDERYLDDIKAITQKLVVLEGVRSVGRSKIYVDSESIRSQLAGEVGELYARYRELLENSVQEIEFSYSTDAYGSLSNEKDAAILTLVRRMRGDGNLVSFMLTRIFNEFVQGEHGLNNFLSSRIRHGTLLNTLSNPFLSENILTVRDEDTDEYAPNEFWLEKLYLPIDGDSEISKLFSRFSDDFYSIVGALKNEKIQVSYGALSMKREDMKLSALFDFALYEADVAFIKSRVDSTMDYRDFMDVVFERFWEHIEIKLEKVRGYIEGDVTTSFKSLFEEFSSDLDALPYYNGKKELNDAFTRARVSFNTAIEEVSSWFNRAEAAELNDFSVNIPLEIADKSISGFDNSGMLFTINESIDDTISINGKYLISFVDIFYPLLDNVIQRSRLPQDERVVDVSVSKEENILTLLVINNTMPRDDIDRVNAGLRVKLDQHMLDFAPHMLAKEGGTGLYKIMKAIKNGLGTEIDAFDAFYSATDEFTVKISFDVKGLLV